MMAAGSGGFFFVHLSDLQVGMYEPGAPTYRETALIQAAVARINALRPAFVICTGDVVDQPGSEAQLGEARRLLAGIDRTIPLHVVPGNHDIGDTPTAADLAWYRHRFGPDWYAFDHGGWHFVGLNSCLMNDGRLAAGEAQAQWTWLQDDLAAAAGRPVLVFMHHPPFLSEAREPDDYFNLGAEPRARLVALLRQYDAGLVFAGHLHCCGEGADAGLTVVASGPVGMPLGDGVSGLRIVRVGGGDPVHRYFALEDAAGQDRFAGNR